MDRTEPDPGLATVGATVVGGGPGTLAGVMSLRCGTSPSDAAPQLLGVETPAQLIDITRLPLAQVEELPGGKGVRIGALARNSDVAEHPLVHACELAARHTAVLPLE